MLVMYTLNNSIASKLPQTSTIKFIDIWIIYGLFLHFLILLLLVMIEHLPGNNNLVFVENSNSEIPKHSITAQGVAKLFGKKVLPIFTIVFVLSYATCACIIYNM